MKTFYPRILLIRSRFHTSASRKLEFLLEDREKSFLPGKRQRGYAAGISSRFHDLRLARARGRVLHGNNYWRQLTAYVIN
jgi:hypothetical protein